MAKSKMGLAGKLAILITILACSVGLTVAALAESSRAAGPTVTNVTASGRDPWSGLVDITYEITGDTTNLYIAITATDGSGNTWEAKTFDGDAPSLEPGTHQVIWVASADAPDVVASDAVVTVALMLPDVQPTAAANTADMKEGDKTLSVTDMADGVLGNDDFGVNAPGTVVGVVAGTASEPSTTGVGQEVQGAYGKLTLAADGTYTYTLTANVPKDQTVEDVFTYTIRDRDDDTATATLTISIEDEAPTVQVTINSVDVKVDETYLVDSSTTPTKSVTIDLSKKVKIVAGTDVPYSSSMEFIFAPASSSPTQTNLFALGNDGSKGDSIYLYWASDSELYGATEAGNQVNEHLFELSLDEDGNLTFVLIKPIWHENGVDPDDYVTFNNDSGLVTASIELVFEDAHTYSNQFGVSDVTVKIYDDGPEVEAEDAPQAIVLDESNMYTSGDSGLSDESDTTKTSFTIREGADGAKVEYSIVVDSEPSLTALIDGKEWPVLLSGANSSTLKGKAEGEDIFTVTVDEEGLVSVDMPGNGTLKHPDYGNADDSLSIEGLSVKCTVTDRDGDVAVATTPLTLSVKDDGPTLTAGGNLSLEAGTSCTQQTLTLSYGADIPTGSTLTVNGQSGTDAGHGMLTFSLDKGTLLLKKSGTGYLYVYTAKAATELGFDGERKTTEDLLFAIEDADGDTATATVTVTIVDPTEYDDPILEVNNPSLDVYEAGLSRGSGTGDTAVMARGTMSLVEGTAPLKEFTVSYTDADGNSREATIPASGGAVMTKYGAVELGYRDVTLSYTYTLTDNSLGHSEQGMDTVTESFGVVAKDTAGGTSGDAQVVTVTVHDDMPTLSCSDTELIVKSGNEVSGTATAAFGADGNEGSDIAVSVTMEPSHGKVVITANGGETYTYTYTADGVDEETTDEFTLAVTDADGDRVTETVHVTIKAAEPVSGFDPDSGAVIDGAGLPGGVIGWDAAGGAVPAEGVVGEIAVAPEGGVVGDVAAEGAEGEQEVSE